VRAKSKALDPGLRRDDGEGALGLTGTLGSADRELEPAGESGLGEAIIQAKRSPRLSNRPERNSNR
jgi:hypothetical protein